MTIRRVTTGQMVRPSSGSRNDLRDHGRALAGTQPDPIENLVQTNSRCGTGGIFGRGGGAVTPLIQQSEL